MKQWSYKSKIMRKETVIKDQYDTDLVKKKSVHRKEKAE